MRIFLDITRTLVHAKNATPTGIDRVEHAYIRGLLARAPDLETWYIVNTPYGRGALSHAQARTVFSRIARKYATTGSGIENASLLQLIDALSRPTSTARKSPEVIRGPKDTSVDDVWGVARAFASGAHRFRSLMADGKPTIYLHTSHLQLDDIRCFLWLQNRPLFPVFFIHDLIPIEFPEFCSTGAAQKHQARIDTILRFGKAVLVNSEFTRQSLARYAGTTRCPPTGVVPLANTIEPLTRSQVPDVASPVPYFLHVGTIEGRKNIGHLLNVWRYLIMTHGAEHTPRLLLIGKRGWECENVTAVLDRSSTLANHVIEVSGVNDAGVHALMQSAVGLITVSMTEGFGLPPVEAAQIGLPVIASDIPAHREILGDWADFVAPHDGAALADKVMALVAQHGRARKSNRIPAYNWEQHVSDALAFIDGQVSATR